MTPVKYPPSTEDKKDYMKLSLTESCYILKNLQHSAVLMNVLGKLNSCLFTVEDIMLLFFVITTHTMLT